MPHIDSKLLSKIQSIKTLRDRAGTDGERDAAQGKLTLILAKHKLTEQDIPEPGFSTRGRSQEYTSSRRPGRSENARNFEKDFFQTMTEFEEAIRNASRNARSRPHKPPPKKQRPYSYAPPNPRGDDDLKGARAGIKTSAKLQWEGRLLYMMGKALGQFMNKFILGDGMIVWTIDGPRADEVLQVCNSLISDLKKHCRLHMASFQPKNSNAFRRAFFEAATYEIAARLRGGVTQIPHYKSREPRGIESGREIGLTISLVPLI